METKEQILEQLNSIREEIEKEQVSYGEISYLNCHKQEVLDTGDILLCQWAGISEDEYNSGELFDERYHVGRIIELSSVTEDTDLDDFTEEHGEEVRITEIEGAYFWGVSTKSNVTVPYHMEYQDIADFTDKVVRN